MLDWVQRLNSESCKVLVTPSYTIESSLPQDFRSRFFRDVEEGTRLEHVSGRKVEIAELYADTFMEWMHCFDPMRPMDDRVTSLVTTISLWNLSISS